MIVLVLAVFAMGLKDISSVCRVTVSQRRGILEREISKCLLTGKSLVERLMAMNKPVGERKQRFE